jgi:hypothetical protein
MTKSTKSNDHAHPQQKQKQNASRKLDLRKQLFNNRKVGSFQKVQLPAEMITRLWGILLDIDPSLFCKDKAPENIRMNPAKFYKRVIRPMLARNPVLAKAEVRLSGRGLHLVVWFKDPVEFATDADRQRWAAIIKVIQRLLPTDPHCPGITALTRALGSVNSKNNVTVKQLHEGEPVSSEEVVDLFNLTRTSPFRTVAQILFGGEHLQPCPVCDAPDSRLDILDHVGQCYGNCGKVRLGQLFDVFLKPRLSKKS